MTRNLQCQPPKGVNHLKDGLAKVWLNNRQFQRTERRVQPHHHHGYVQIPDEAFSQTAIFSKRTPAPNTVIAAIKVRCIMGQFNVTSHPQSFVWSLSPSEPSAFHRLLHIKTTISRLFLPPVWD